MRGIRVLALLLFAFSLFATRSAAAQDGEVVEAGTSGTIAIVGNVCDDPADASNCTSIEITGITITDPDGRVLTEADASLHGANRVWDDDALPFGDYSVDISFPTPDGLSFAGLDGASPNDSGGWAFSISEEAPNAYLTLIFESVAAAALDSDGDGFDDETEAEAGTDPFDPQSFPAAAGSSTLLVNAFLCPIDYDGSNYAADCPGGEGTAVNVATEDNVFAAVSGTDASGNAIFGGLAEDVYRIDLGIPGDFADFQTVCGTPDGFEPRQHDGQNSNSIAVYVGPSEVLTCSFYVLPIDAQGELPQSTGDSTLIVNALLCPIDYDGSNYAEDCLGEAGIPVNVASPGNEYAGLLGTEADGSAVFYGLAEENYTIELGIPGDFADFRTVCGTPDGFEPRQHEGQDSNRITVYVAPAEELTCTFFVLPIDAKGDIDGEPVTQLPATGTGDDNAPALPIALIVIALIATVVAVSTRRRLV